MKTRKIKRPELSKELLKIIAGTKAPKTALAEARRKLEASLWLARYNPESIPTTIRNLKSQIPGNTPYHRELYKVVIKHLSRLQKGAA